MWKGENVSSQALKHSVFLPGSTHTCTSNEHVKSYTDKNCPSHQKKEMWIEIQILHKIM